jgi:pimeloyl-ACP methyl ester carboxylesterase
MHSISTGRVLLLVGLLGQSVFARPACGNNSTHTITWTNCTAQDPPNLDCGTIQVPLGHDDPSGEKITLFIARLKANGTSRVGSLIWNPGGPGDYGSYAVFEAAQGIPRVFSQRLMENYDIIGLDPRGTGQSNPVKCDHTIMAQRVSVMPKNEADFQKLAKRSKDFGESCKQMTGPLINHLDTTHVIKDMEIVRQALSQGKLNYLGLSYGTLLGSAYAELYPENVGRMVLDGITDHSVSEISNIASVSVGLEITLNKWFEWCNTTTDCVLHGQDAAGIFDKVVVSADLNPIPAPGCLQTNLCRSDVSGEEIIIAVKWILGHPETWPALGVAIAQAAQGDASLFSNPNFTNSSEVLFSSIAIGVQDFPRNAKTLTDFLQREKMVQALAPHTKGLTVAWNLLVATVEWPTQLTNPPHVLHQRISNAPPILLVASVWDPATPIDMANNIRIQIPQSSLVVRNGGGHCSYQTFGDTTAAIDEFLITGTMPVDGTNYDS